MVGKARLVEMSEARSATKSAVILLDEPVLLLAENPFECSDDRHGGYAEPKWDVQILIKQFADSVSAP